MTGHSSIRLMILSSVVLAGILVQPRSYAEDSLKRLIKCKPNKQVVSTNAGSVLLRSFPFLEFDSIEVPPGGTGLLYVLAQKDVFSVAIQQIRYPKKEDAEVHNPFFVGKPSSGDRLCAIFHIRGNEITVFPRSMLIHPLVAMSLVKQDDVVVTIELEKNSLQKAPINDNPVQELNKTDPIHKWFYDNFANELERESVSITLTGELIPSTLHGIREIKPRLPINPFPGSLPLEPPQVIATSLATVLEENVNIEGNLDIKGLVNASAIGDLLAVSVVKRRVGPYLIRYVAPLKYSGAFRNGSKYYSSLFKVQSPSTDWNPSLDNFLQLPLIDGDTLEITSFRSVPLFQRQGMLIPLN